MKQKYSRAFSIAWLVVWYLAACLFVAKYASNFIDADMSSELVLARLLADEGSLISKNWFYSTELRVLNTQLVFMPLFLVFDNWHTVRVLGTVILLTIMVISSLYCARGMKLSWNISLICAGVLLLPISESYAYAVLKGTYYIPHICVSFFLFGLYARYAESDSSKKRWIMLAVALILAFVSGLGGIRQVFVFTFPAALAAILTFIPSISREAEDKAKKFCEISVLALAASTLGYFVNKLVLQRVYTFVDYGGEMSFEWFDIEGVGIFVNRIFELLGWRPGTLFSGTLIYNGIVAVLLFICIFSVYYLLKKAEIPFVQKALALLALSGCGMFLALFSCINSDMTTRYLVPVIVFFVFAGGALFDNIRLDKKLKSLSILALCAMLAFSTLGTYRYHANVDKNISNRDISRVIEENGFDEGYAGFWNGNIFTELSNGDVEVRLIDITKEGSKDNIYNSCEWLQDKSHVGTVPDGRFFVLLTKSEDAVWQLPRTPDYVNDAYVLYFFDDYADFAALYGE